MRKDMLAQAEEVFGKGWGQFNEGEMALAILAHVAEGQRVTAAYKSMGDTHSRMTWDEFKGLLTNYGFVIPLVDEFYPKPYHTEELIVAFHPAKCLLLCATSYHGKINGGHVYAEVWTESPCTDAKWLGLGSYSGGHINPVREGEERLRVDYDVREGLLCKLERIELAGWHFTESWTKGDRHLWLVDYAQEKESGDHADQFGRGGFYDRCKQERLDRLPEEVRQRLHLTAPTPIYPT
jgi:hypothetical protein